MLPLDHPLPPLPINPQHRVCFFPHPKGTSMNSSQELLYELFFSQKNRYRFPPSEISVNDRPEKGCKTLRWV
jgi:hypothetical protein